VSAASGHDGDGPMREANELALAAAGGDVRLDADGALLLLESADLLASAPPLGDARAPGARR
jgi:hypothetical protein